MKLKNKTKATAPVVSELDRWRGRVTAYCHECWGRGGFEMLTDKVWRRFWESEVRPDLTEYEFAMTVVLQWCAHHYWHKGQDTLQKPATFATRGAVRAVRRRWAVSEEHTKQYKDMLDRAKGIAAKTSVPETKARPEPPPPCDAGRFEQPPRGRDRRLRVMRCKSGAPPYRLTSITYPALIKWCESVTEWMESKGEFPTVGCLVRWVHDADGPADRDECVLAARRIAALYHTEYEDEKERDRRQVDLWLDAPVMSEPKPEKADKKPAKPPKVVDARSKIVTVVGEGDQKKYTVFGHPVTAVIRWMGKDAWTFDEARLLMTRLGIPEVKDNTLKAQLMTGRKGDGYGGRKPAAKLTGDQQETLYALLEQKDGTTPPAEQAGQGQRPGRQAAEERGSTKTGRKAQAPAVQGRPAQEDRVPARVPHSATDRGRSSSESRGAEGRPARVRPADQPAGGGGRASRPDAGEKGRAPGVGGKRPDPSRRMEPGGRRPVGTDKRSRPPAGSGVNGRKAERGGKRP